MDRFFGSAILEFAGKKEPVSLCLNLSDNVFEARFPIKDMKECFGLHSEGYEWMTQNIRLRDIDIKLPHGRLLKDIYEDIFVKNYEPGPWSIHDSTLSRALDLQGKEVGITTIIITPRISGVTFNFERLSGDISAYELFYNNNKIRMIHNKINFNSVPIFITGDESGLVLSSEFSINEVRQRFLLSWSIIQGTPLNLRSILDGNDLTLNLSSGTHTSGLGPLAVKENDILSMLQCFNVWLGQMNKDVFSHWERASYFYLEGVSTNTYLETRVINLFTFLEMVDDSDTLTKESIKKLLEITSDEADIIYKVRQSLIHRGESLNYALSKAKTDLKNYKGNDALNLQKLFDIYHIEPNKIGTMFYLLFAACIARFWARQIGYTGVMYQYEDTIRDTKSRHGKDNRILDTRDKLQS